MREQIRRLCAGFPVATCWLSGRPLSFPLCNALSHDRIDRLLKGGPGFVRGNGEKAGRFSGKQFPGFRDGDGFALPADAAQTKTDDLV